MEKYKNDVIRLQKEIFSYLKNESNIPEESLLNFSSILMDEALIYRFYRKNQFSIPETKEDIIDHLIWLIDENVFENTFDSFEYNTNAYNYLLNGFIYFCGHDKLGRPIGIMNLNHYNGNGDIESLKKYMIFILEIVQKLIREDNRKNKNSIENSYLNNSKNTKEWDIQTQFSIILDLDNLKMSTLNYEVFPSLIKIFINHYPYIAETVYILNYRWIHAGLWGMVKQMLSESITKNMFFLKKDEIFEYIDPNELISEYGGNNYFKYNCHTYDLFQKYGKKEKISIIPLHLLETDIPKVEPPNYDTSESDEHWFDACSNDNDFEDITEEIIQNTENEIERPSILLPYSHESSIKNEPDYPIKEEDEESKYLYEDDSVLNISYHPIKLTLKEDNQINNNKMTQKSSLSPKHILYTTIRHLLMPLYAYVRCVRCASVYYELVLSRWMKKFSQENEIPPSFNYLSFFITKNTNMSTGATTNEQNDMANISQVNDIPSSSSSVTSTTLVSPTAINYTTDQTSNYRTNYQSTTSSSATLNQSPTTHSSPHQTTPFDRTNNGSLSWKDINSLVQHTLRTCLPENYNPFSDSVTILIFFASIAVLTHLIYPRNRYRIHNIFWKYFYKFRREIYVFLGLRPNRAKSIIQVI